MLKRILAHASMLSSVVLCEITVFLFCTKIAFFLVEIYCDITTALWSRDGSAVVSLHL